MFFLGGKMFFIVPFNASPIYTGQITEGWLVPGSQSVPPAMLLTLPRVPYSFSDKYGFICVQISPTTRCPPPTDCAGCFSSGRSCWPCPSRSERWQPGVQVVSVPPCRRVSPSQLRPVPPGHPDMGNARRSVQSKIIIYMIL